MQTPVRSDSFSLVEVVVALAVISFALVAILGLLPLGLQSAQDAVEDTRTSMIAQDVSVRLNAIPLPATPSTQFTTNWWYDVNGRYQGSNYTNALYQASAVRGPLNAYPSNTSTITQDAANTTYGTQLEGAVVSVAWPINPATGGLLPGSQSNDYTFYLRVTPNN